MCGRGSVCLVAEGVGLPVLASVPMDPTVAESDDSGRMEEVNTDPIAPVVEAVEKA